MKSRKGAMILAGIAASYARRELDRSFYDDVMRSRAGQRLNALSQKQKYALEFLAYAASSTIINHKSDTSATARFLAEVAADAPAEIAKRMMNQEPRFSGDDLRFVLGQLEEDDIEDLASMDSVEQVSVDNDNSKSQSLLGKLADRIEESSARTRARKKGRT